MSKVAQFPGQLGRLMTTPIQQLIDARRRELGLSRHDVVRRCGYANLSKGHRRLDALLGGDLHTARGLIDRLPSALDAPAATVIEAVAATRQQQEAAAEAAYRAAFRPHGIILTEHERPTNPGRIGAINGGPSRGEKSPCTGQKPNFAGTKLPGRSNSPRNATIAKSATTSP